MTRNKEGVIGGLEAERGALAATLEAQTLSPERIRSIYEFADAAMKGLEIAGADFPTRRKILELLDVGVTITIENGEKVAYARCVLGEDVLPPISTATSGSRRPKALDSSTREPNTNT